MKYCPYCKNELEDDQMLCPQCGFQFVKEQNHSDLLEDDKVNVWLVVLSFLIPLVGFIYWGVKKNERPKGAKACLTAGIIGFIVNLFLMA